MKLRMVKLKQNDLIKIKIRSRGSKYANQDRFNWTDYPFAYIHASEVLDLVDKYLTVERNQSVIRYELDESAEDIVNRINEKLNSKK